MRATRMLQGIKQRAERLHAERRAV